MEGLACVLSQCSQSAFSCTGRWRAGASDIAASETKTFEVIAVDGNQLVVKLPEGTREITVPEGFRFNVEGKQLSVQELIPGMHGTATITSRTTVTPVTVTEVKNGQVVIASGGAIYVRTSEGVKMFTQGDIDKRGVKIMRGGKPATVSNVQATHCRPPSSRRNRPRS